MFRTSTEIVISIPTPHLGADARQRLSHLLVEYVVEGGRAETFSVQSELVRPDAPANVPHDLEALLGHLELRRGDAISTLIRPTRWPVDPRMVGWLKRVGPWVHRVMFWSGNQWILQSNVWGKNFELLAQPSEWAQFGSMVENELGMSLSAKTTPLRKHGVVEKRGWSVSRNVRRTVALAAGLGAGVVAYLSGAELLEGLLPVVGVALVVFFHVPQREPGPFERLFGRADLPSDPGFHRRVIRLMGLGLVGTLVWAFAGAAGLLAEPGSTWRTAWWILAALGFFAFAFWAVISLRWLLKHQVH